MRMRTLGWFGIFRLGLVQTALGAIVVLTTSTLNRVMVVELLLPAMLPGILVGLHSALQISRPLWGHASDVSARRQPWIVAGMAVLGLGGALAAQATAMMQGAPILGVGLAVVAYLLVGAGVGAAGTALLALLAASVPGHRKAAAASIVWLMMIAGFIVTTAVVGSLLDPFSFELLVVLSCAVSVAALIVTCVALFGLEGGLGAEREEKAGAPERPFREVFAEVWSDARARAFTIFVFVAMLAYNTQDLILEPFAGAVFGFSPGASTQLTSVQHTGVLIGMLTVAFAAGGRAGPRFGSIKTWTIVGCALSGVVLLGLAVIGFVVRESWALRGVVGVLGFANGAFAVAAIGWMMSLASQGPDAREGIRMGLWGGAQAIAFALGSFVGTLGVDLVRYSVADPILPYAAVFVAEGALFFAAARLALRMDGVRSGATTTHLVGASLAPEDLPPRELGSAQPV
jgi:BCD family chlorophyll transporter-like MFS transporter